MNLTIENILLVGSVLLLLSIFASKTSYKFGVPTLLLFLGIGMLSGSEAIGKIHFDNPYLAQFIGVFCLNFILFSGGLDTDFKAVRPILAQGVVLSSLGVFLTAIFLGLFVYAVTDFSIYESLLLGSIVSSTDAAAVFSILRSKSLALKYNLRPTLELESGSNDPMAYVLTILFLSLVLSPQKDFLEIVPVFLQQMILGGVLGLGFGKLSRFIINKINLDFEGLYFALVISLMFITFSFTDFIGGNGFLAIYICAVYLGNQELMHKKSILKLYDGLSWLMQIVLFLTLGLLVFPSEILPVFWIGLFVSLFLIFVARPLSVFISLAFFKMKLKKRLYISWVGLRGAVPIVFATYPLIAGIEKANMIFNIVFFVSVSSVLLQGTTLGIIAKWLKVSLPSRVKPMGIEKLTLNEPKDLMKELQICTTSKAINKKIVDLNLPDDLTIALVARDGKYIVPTGQFVLQESDSLFVLANKYEQLECFLDASNKETK